MSNATELGRVDITSLTSSIARALWSSKLSNAHNKTHVNDFHEDFSRRQRLVLI